MKCIYIAMNKYDKLKIDWIKEVCATNKWGKLCMIFWGKYMLYGEYNYWMGIVNNVVKYIYCEWEMKWYVYI